MIFDTHAHYDDEAFDEDREELLAKMEPSGIAGIVNMGASLAGVEESQKLADQYPFIYAAVGVHPDEVGSLDEEKLHSLYELCRRDKTVAVGEIGLDYYWNKENHDTQKQWFVRQLQMAKDVNLPVNIHSRDAAQDTFDIMKAEHAGTTGGIIHCFSASAQMAREYVKLGYYIGVGGVVTFKNARVMKEVVAAVPMDHIVIETDCPYLAPAPHRGRRNSSLYLPLVIEAIAGIRGMTPQEVEDLTYENALRVYRIFGDSRRNLQTQGDYHGEACKPAENN
ncbi:MAG: TatD family hydrolase [Lachnospiraceae bacterium]|nr:TatD family hydrolase [Lachnospiraceae bacterium]